MANLIDIRSVTQLGNAKFPEYVQQSHSKLHNVIWRTPLQNIYVVKKPWNYHVRDAMVQFIDHIHHHYPAVNVIVNEDVADELVHEFSSGGCNDLDKSTKHILYTGKFGDIVDKTDLVVTLGGDGTILRAVSTFSNVTVPPVLSFALGTLGFLLPFDFKKASDTFRMVYESRAKALHRNRLECHVLDHYKHQGQVATMVHAMNDISLHRGSQPNLTSLDIYIDNEFLTTTTADGIVFSTPTGSTAYSLSAGGSITHPLVPCILLTPICPRSLSFRPLILPSTCHIMIRLSELNRNSSIELTIDGIPQRDLLPGDSIHVVSEKGTIYVPGQHEPPTTLSRHTNTANTNSKGIWCIARSEHDWTKDINELLGFNSSFQGKKQYHM
ncbi:protein involved in oxidative stress [Scheffersomyces stipitis CBS 6054]|uniref:Protein involved in oxidative stress n=1 Tax=Scheffersomyces stipitis (strain ATCC 58785 / CBS 6054 / NBRC 10063 / NRRL Y-11545) TaxID=322104 RepID=A3GHN0_PICST|nr:protein involved in oxidative stress [Scheffersomyces stipitis CBS 6054]EAZ62852.2 protein involved in oxidative stress [Scheffersomyces stipitis CBS 6054]